MTESENKNPYSSPADDAVRPVPQLTAGDWLKLTISMVVLLLILPFIPFGLPGKLAYAFGTSYAIYNYYQKLRSTRNVFACPNCDRVLGAYTRICPRCDHRFG